MIPAKEKAIELFDKFYDTTPNEAWINEPLCLSTGYKSWNQAKQCALIALEEMQEVYASVTSAIPQLNETKKYRSVYLDEVKQEIEKL